MEMKAHLLTTQSTHFNLEAEKNVFEADIYVYSGGRSVVHTKDFHH